MEYLKLYHYFIAFSFLASLLVYTGPSKELPYLKFFPPFLLITLIAECWGAYLSSVGSISSRQLNTAMYNFFSTFEFCFYLWFISILISKPAMKKSIRITMVAYALVAIINILFIQKIYVFHTTTYSLGCLLVVIFCIYYFLELFRLPKSVKLISSPAFWICTGLLFFYICGFPMYGFIKLWMNVDLVAKNFGNIVNMLNVFLYSLFTIALLCSKIRKYSLSQS
jgi:hypothetical protein